MRFEPRPRLVDWTILGALLAALGSGVGTLFAGEPGDWWIVTLHAVVGILLVVPLAFKLRRERWHLHPGHWSRRTVGSILLAAISIATIGTGVVWAFGLDLGVLVWSGLVVHAFLGVLLVPLLLVHLRRRFHVPRRVDFEGRRTVLQMGLLVAGGVLAFRAQGVLVSLLDAAGSTRRFTGSKPAGGEGNDFPTTSWVADDPDPIDPADWQLRVRGAVAGDRTFALSDLDDLGSDEGGPFGSDDGDELSATLDCTSGWYAARDWRGIRVDRLLDAAGASDDARWVSFRSVTGYRFSLPVAEAEEALLATHVGAERLDHGHGFPARLVAPGRRGFQWVKWVESIDVRTAPDYGQWWAIFTSGFG